MPEKGISSCSKDLCGDWSRETQQKQHFRLDNLETAQRQNLGVWGYPTRSLLQYWSPSLPSLWWGDPDEPVSWESLPRSTFLLGKLRQLVWQLLTIPVLTKVL